MKSYHVKVKTESGTREYTAIAWSWFSAWEQAMRTYGMPCVIVVKPSGAA
jgi:hypothetical protein